MEGRKRKYFLVANWKQNGTTAFTKDIVTNLFNTFTYDPSKLGIQFPFLTLARCDDIARPPPYVFSQGNGPRQCFSRVPKCELVWTWTLYRGNLC